MLLGFRDHAKAHKRRLNNVHAWVQVTTFKVRTIRSQGGSNDQASAALTWTTAEEGCLDTAAGGQGQLLARAMSIAGVQL